VGFASNLCPSAIDAKCSDFAPAAAVILPANAKTLYISGVVGDSADGSFGDFRTQVFLIFEVIESRQGDLRDH
jgi:hypothetical protein